MAQLFLTPINLNKNELQNARIQNLASAPSVPVAGQVYYDTTLNQTGIYQNGVWVYVAAAIANTVTKSTAAVAAGVNQVSGGADRTLTDYAGGAGLVKSAANGVFSAAASGSDYSAGTSALTTGIVKTTTGTGALTTAVAADFPTLNQATTASAGSLSNVLNTSSVPAFTGDVTNTVGTLVSSITPNAVTLAKMAQIATGTILGNPTAGTANVSLITLGAGISMTTAGVLSATGNGGTVTTASVANANGFSGSVATASTTPTITLSTSLSAGIIKSNGAGAIVLATVGTDYSTPSSTDTFTNKSINASNNTITNLTTGMFATSVIDNDGTLAANSSTRIATQSAVVSYVNNAVQGVQWKAPVRAATTVAGTLASSFANGSIIDGVTLVTGDRILLMGQANGYDNGIYTVNATGVPTRANDAITGAEVKGLVVAVLEGTSNTDAAFINTNTGTAPTLGTTTLTFTNFVTSNVPLATTSIAGKVILSTVTLAEAKADSAKALVASNLVNFPIKRTSTIGDGSTTAYVISHNLGTQDVTVSVRDASSNNIVYTDVSVTSTNSITVTFSAAPASGAYKVVIIG